MSYRVAVVGATGLVGRTMLTVLEERNFPIAELRLLASERSAGKRIKFNGRNYTIAVLDENSFDGIDIALFSAGGSTSLRFAPIAAQAGAVVIDNSSAWRMDRNVPLVVPEVNPEAAFKHKGIIANPNCSTIQLVVALKPLQEKFGLKRVLVSTYQSISGAGQLGVDQLMAELKGKEPKERKFSRQAAFNTIFHSFPEGNDSTEEETKMMNETRKIMSLPKLPIAVTCVRIPTVGAHAESVNVELTERATPGAVRKALARNPGTIVIDDPKADLYPTVLEAAGRDEVFVGRIRKDPSQPNTFNLWVVADNLRKGAATNAVQIAEVLAKGA
jgi:aspartate-semialdehyde dehydrogenase